MGIKKLSLEYQGQHLLVLLYLWKYLVPTTKEIHRIKIREQPTIYYILTLLFINPIWSYPYE